VWIAAWIFALVDLEDVVPLVILCVGVWNVGAAAVRASRSSDGWGAFGTFGWGLLFVVLGSSFYMVNKGFNPAFVLVLLLVLFGLLAIIAALRSSR
jgi:hypothetical protein